jgi:recombination protein RecA
MGDSHMGLQARLMSQALRKLTAAVAKSRVSLIFTNQLREKIGVMFGSPETTTGGKALKFYASVRLDIRRIAQIKDGQNVIGNRTKVKVVKNKVAPPFKEVEFDIIYNEGISKLGDLVDTAVNLEIVQKSGAWFSYQGQRMQGREGVKSVLVENPNLIKQLDKEVREMMGIAPAADVSANGEPKPKEAKETKEKEKSKAAK